MGLQFFARVIAVSTLKAFWDDHPENRNADKSEKERWANMNTHVNRHDPIRHTIISFLALGGLWAAGPAMAGCPAGEQELLPDIRALPPSDLAMLDANTIKFSTTSWNPGDGKIMLVARSPETDTVTGQVKQPVDQRISCSGGSYYDRPAGSAEYHAAHNHVHYNDYANYILEATANSVNPRKGTKTTYCIMDTTGVNTQLAGASGSAVFSWCPTQDPGFNTQGMSIGWGDTYGSNLAGQSLPVGDLPDGTYRLRNVFDPTGKLLEKDEGDNESCKLLELGTGSNGRYVADRGPCTELPVPRIASVSPASAAQNTCVAMTIYGANLAPELRVSFTGGTGPLPSVKNTRFDVAGNYMETTVCVPRARGGKKPLGSDPVWDVFVSSTQGGYASAAGINLFRVTP